MLTPAPFFDFGFQAFSQNAQPSRNAGMIFGAWGIRPNKQNPFRCYLNTACDYCAKLGTTIEVCCISYITLHLPFCCYYFIS